MDNAQAYRLREYEEALVVIRKHEYILGTIKNVQKLSWTQLMCQVAYGYLCRYGDPDALTPWIFKVSADIKQRIFDRWQETGKFTERAKKPRKPKGRMPPKELESARKRYAKNRATILSMRRQRYAENKNAAKEQARKYYAKNKDTINARARKRRAENKNTINAMGKERQRAKNRDKINAAMRERWANDPEWRAQRNAARAAHHARKKAVLAATAQQQSDLQNNAPAQNGSEPGQS